MKSIFYKEIQAGDVVQKLAVLILTKNEENNITDVIDNAKQCTDEIIVIDSGSTDKTVELAEKAGAQVHFRAWDNDFAAQRNFGIKLTNADWVLYLDADERMNDEMIKAIKKVIESEYKTAQYSMLRRTTAFGKEFKYGVLSPDKVKRLFLREDVIWVGKVHESPSCNFPLIELPGFLKHYTYDNWEQYLGKMNQYSSIGAKNYKERGKKAYFFKDILARPFLAFIKMYFLKLGILEGKLGYMLAANYANYTMNKYCKLLALNEAKGE